MCAAGGLLLGVSISPGGAAAGLSKELCVARRGSCREQSPRQAVGAPSHPEVSVSRSCFPFPSASLVEVRATWQGQLLEGRRNWSPDDAHGALSL